MCVCETALMTLRTRVVSVLVAFASVSVMVAVAPTASAASCGIKTAADGSVGPITCKGGSANMAVRNKLRKQSPSVMALGKKASLTQVKAAVCADITKAKADNPTVSEAMQWQTAYYDWAKSYTSWFTKTIVEGAGCAN